LLLKYKFIIIFKNHVKTKKINESSKRNFRIPKKIKEKKKK